MRYRWPQPRGAAMITPGRSRARMGHGVRHPVPVGILYWRSGRFETVEAVNLSAAQELVEKINGEKGTERYAYIRKWG